MLENKTVQLNDILLAPQIKKNLLSISKLCANNSVSLCFDKNHVYLKNLQAKNAEIVIRNVKEGLYQIDLKEAVSTSETNTCTSSDLQIWHSCFGHACEAVTRKLVVSHNLSSANKFSPCKSCILSKHHRLPYKSKHSRSNFSLDLFYANV